MLPIKKGPQNRYSFPNHCSFSLAKRHSEVLLGAIIHRPDAPKVLFHSIRGRKEKATNKSFPNHCSHWVKDSEVLLGAIVQIGLMRPPKRDF